MTTMSTLQKVCVVDFVNMRMLWRCEGRFYCYIILISLLYDNSNVFKIENDEWFMNLLLLLFDYLQAFQRVLPVICNM